MQLLNDVYTNYRAVAHGLVGRDFDDTALTAIKTRLPALFRRELLASGMNADADYRCYGGYGEVNRAFAHVPWVACCNRNISRKVRDGYFIVLLFRGDMAGCWLSLNQGFTQYRDVYVKKALALRQARLGAEALTRMIVAPEGFETGPIDLGAATDLAEGYQAGAIVSRYYGANDPLVTEGRFSEDFRRLLIVYNDLAARAGNRGINLLPDAEAPFQAAAAEIAKNEVPPLPNGPLPPPERIQLNYRGGWRRDPKVAATALRAANNLCEWDNTHQSFIAKRTGASFSEAHHLIPVSRQGDYAHSLDVPENVVSLCPTCHRKIHHGQSSERMNMAADLFRRRETALAQRGIVLTRQEIRRMYKDELEED
ncbi:MrcB family domain-containing protein [Rhizobium rosettiformans]|uniref:MrcB family domain-containing protein n=1 Tax=Rhizobium rosettiformans TaxID=1368430 RepID=UPI0028654AB7|nr:DUF3578 domain-containing protein [Rhizobium rosettiformans]MDR7029826.1 5-methylcytosine-specific restriction protein A [Rhizobium rosettiformans]MDR7063540.1 5-methylcytosine-specific restriction protein A [Rhizobium rosettiformans]